MQHCMVTFTTPLPPLYNPKKQQIVIVSNQGPFKYATERRPELVGRDVAPKLPLEKEGA